MKRIALLTILLCTLLTAPVRAEKYALLVGIDTYSWPIDALDGCVKDVEMMRAALTEKFGFPADNIATLLNEAATFEGMRDAFRAHLIEQAQPGDAVVFYYSGHGSRTDDLNGDETDGFDETLCPVDISVNEQAWLTDDILNQWLGRLRTTQVTVILDACFAGTGTRGSGEYLSKFADLGFRGAPKQAASTNYHAADAPHVLLAASAPDQTSQQIAGKGSVFTLFLTELLMEVAVDVTYQAIMDVIAPAVSDAIAEALPNSPQTPQAEGDLSQPAFAEESVLAEEPVVAEAPASPDAAPEPDVTPPAEQPADLSESVQYVDFALHLSANKTDFQEDDLLTVTVEAARNCYLALYIIDAEQTVTQIFPNTWQQDNFIRAGQTVQIPPDGADFRFRMTGPFGTETLKADVSTTQFPDMANTDWADKSFLELGRLPLAKINTRGVAVEHNPDVERSQAVLRYTVAERRK